MNDDNDDVYYGFCCVCRGNDESGVTVVIVMVSLKKKSKFIGKKSQFSLPGLFGLIINGDFVDQKDADAFSSLATWFLKESLMPKRSLS